MAPEDAATAPMNSKKHRRRRKRKHRQQEEEVFFSPAASPLAAAAVPPRQDEQRLQQSAEPLPQQQRHQQEKQPQQQQQQQLVDNQSVRVNLTILPSPLREPRRGRRSPGPRVPQAPAAPAQQVLPAGPPTFGSSLTGPTIASAAAANDDQPAAAAAAAAAIDVPAAATATDHKDGEAAGMVDEAVQVGQLGGGGRSKRRRQRKERKRLTAKGKRAAVMSVVAEVELRRATAAAADLGPAEDAGNSVAPSPRLHGTPEQQEQGQGQQPPSPMQQQQQEQQQAAYAAGGAAPAAEQPPATLDAAATANLGKAWSKADISTLAKLAEDRPFLLETIPGHPAEGELDWELIARHFGRYSRGGTAVRQQYYSVVRLMKQARNEGRKGASYVDLVRQALGSLPDRQGTIFEVQAVLKRDHLRCLDKYRVKGTLRWKSAVREVLHDQPHLFEQAGKTATGKIIWRLREAAAS